MLDGRFATLVEAWPFPALVWSVEDKPALTPLVTLACCDRREAAQTFMLKPDRDTRDMGLHI